MVKFEIKKLIIAGNRKNYYVKFKKGLNIIVGDSDTGKSSILELINYVLGSSKIDLYTELESTGRSCYLELQLGETVYTLKRELLNPKHWISAYCCTYDNIETQNRPALLAPNFSTKAPDGYLSDFLLKNLSLPTIKIKEAPSKPDSKMVRMSFRDIFKFMYLDQDDVGSRGILDQKNPSVKVKNKEVFKFIFNFLDIIITELQQSISSLTQERNKLKTKLDIIQEFLSASNFENYSEIENGISETKLELNAVLQSISELTQKMKSSTNQYVEIKNELIKLDNNENTVRFEIEQTQKRISKYVKLKNDYIQDIDKLKTSQKMASISSGFKEEIICPICSNEITSEEYMKHFEKSDLSIIDDEIKFLQRGKKDLIRIINQERVRNEELEVDLNKLVKSSTDIRNIFDTKTKDIISPFIQERDALIGYKAKLKEEIKHKNDLLKIAKQKLGIIEQISTLDGNIETQTKKLEKQLSEIQSEDNILTELANILDNYLTLVSIKNKTGIGISDKTYLPVVRNKDYVALTSGGLRTIVSIGYFLSILRYNIENELSLPPVLLVDTVGKYLSKITKEKYIKATDSKEDEKEYVTDPKKYKNIYSFMIATVELAKKNDKICQIIVVDNDLPPELTTELQNDIIVEFDADSTGEKAKGLIDDA